MSKPNRVLQVMASTMRAGVEMTVMNLYREMDTDVVQFDFIVHDIGDDDFGEQITRMGGRVFRIPLLSKVGIPKFLKIVYDIMMQNGPYMAVHTHTDFQGGFFAKVAKKAEIPVRICHAHTDSRPMHSLSLFAKRMLGRVMISMFATQRAACSRNAGLALFGKHATRKGLVKVIYNSIDLSGFESALPQKMIELRKLCGAGEDTRLIGFVGRLNAVKNPSFVLDMAVESRKRNLNHRFIFVGTGDMRELLMEKRDSFGLADTVVFLGTRDDVPALMQCLSMVVVPSLAEGFSLVTVEAQAAGTPVLAASCIPEEADMGLGLLQYMRLDEGAGAWVDQIETLISSAMCPDTQTRIGVLRDKGFDAKTNVDVMMRLYGISARN